MQHFRFLFVITCLTCMSAYAARQNTPQRVHFKIAIEPRQVRLLLPRSNTIELSAATMERDVASNVMRIKGDAEIRVSLGPSSSTALRTEEALYDLNKCE